MKIPWFKPREPKIQIVELEPRRPLQAPDADTMLSLEHHPGFQYILECLKLQREALKAQLISENIPDLRTVDNLKLGIRWSQWLEHLLRNLTHKARSVAPLDPTNDELREFQRILGTYKLIGN